MSAIHYQRPTSSLAALFHKAGEIGLCQLPVPTPEGGEALVQVTCCTICGSDLHTYSGARNEATPSILGHEIVGRVVEVGDPPLCDLTGSPLQIGDRITWSMVVACGQCDRCRRDIPQKCRQLVKYGHEQATGRAALSGGFAEYILLRPGTSVVQLGDHLPDVVCCPVNCATATVVAACRAAGELAGRHALVFGAGMLGLTASAYLKSCGAKKIVVCDVNEQRLEQARDFGASDVAIWHDDIDHLRDRLVDAAGLSLFDVILDMSGAPRAVEAACQLADVAAHVVLVGTVMPGKEVRLDAEQIVRRLLTIRGVHNYAPRDLQEGVDFLRRTDEQTPFAQLVEKTYCLEQIGEALEYAMHHRPVRVAIRPS